MKSLGLDLSLTNTGIVLIADGDVEFETIIKSKPLGKKPIQELRRINSIVTRIEKLIESHEIDIVVIEGIFLHATRTSALTRLAALNYLVRDFFFKKETDFLIVPPSVLKKFITGKGNASKDIMILETYKRYDRTYDNNNICDAYGLAKMGESVLNTDITLTKFQEEAIKKITPQLCQDT